MIPDKIKTLFEFINFLDENKETFTGYNDNFDKAISLRKEQSNFNPNKSFSDRIEYEKLDKLKKKEFDKVCKNVTKTINKKVTDLGIQKYNNVWYFGSEDELKKKATFEDLFIIKDHLNKYFEFRDVGYHYFHQIFFEDLDRFLIDIADYFGNKYKDKFKDNPIKINDLADAIESFNKTGKTNFSISLDNFFKDDRQQSKVKIPVEPQQIPKNKKPGRKSVEVKEAEEYLQKFDLPENKVKFLNALKNDYSDATPKIFNHVMIALNELGYLKPASKTEYRQAFEKALSREPQSKQNFDKQFEIDPSTLKNTKFYEGIKSNIREIIQSKTLA